MEIDKTKAASVRVLQIVQVEYSTSQKINAAGRERTAGRKEMGLDITVYTDAVLTTEDNEDSVWCFNAKEFEARRGNMAEGNYLATEFDGFRAGSYGGYNAWRNTLCQTVYGILAEEFWATKPNDFTGPFAEIINFSDCEGFLGTSICSKLADDFDEHYDRLAALDGDHFWNLDKWRDGLRQAGSNNGMVRFH